MKVVSTDALTKLIQLVKSAFVKVEDVTETQEVTLADVATSGSYNDLSDKPTIPAAQVNSDWNASSGVAQILNKPTLATVATSGSYNDLSNKPTIPSEVTESTVSGWGFTKNTGTVTSVNNISPVSGNVTLSIPTDTDDLTNSAGFITSSALNGYATQTWVGEQGFLTSVPTATTSSLGLVQPDGTTVTINNGVISANASAPSNMVTTDTAQTITGAKTFSLAAGTIFQNSNNTNGSAKLGVYDTSSYRGGILLENNYQAYRYYPSLTFGYNGYGMTSNAHITMYANSSYGGPLCIANGTSGVINIGSASPSTSGTYTGLRIKADGTLLEYNNNSVLTSASVDGTTITYNSTTGKISAVAATAWGNITGTLSNQTDLQTALNNKTLVTIRDWSVA